MTQGPTHEPPAPTQDGSDDLTLWVERLFLSLDKWGEPYEVVHRTDKEVIIGVEAANALGLHEAPYTGLSITIALTE